MVNLNVSIRRAVLNDQGRISNLIYFESHVHRHLDWRSPLDWLGADEYWVLEQGNHLVAALACPSDPAGIAWIRLFAHSRSISARESWAALWSYAYQHVVVSNRQTAAAITLQPWFGELLQQSGFALGQRIVVLEKDQLASISFPAITGAAIRPMSSADLPTVADLDAAAFMPIWQNSQISLQMAFAQAGLATVIEENGRLLAYQISTSNPFGLHLARLAVLPDVQGRGLGKSLLQDILQYAAHHGMQKITVNTQADNQPSLALYQGLGFRVTGEQYPTYVISLPRP